MHQRKRKAGHLQTGVERTRPQQEASQVWGPVTCVGHHWTRNRQTPATSSARDGKQEVQSPLLW